MKATELMIGNWVIVYEKAMPVKARVEGVFGRGAMVLGHVRSADHGFMEPIPLTQEILEKNGFECRGAWCLPGEDLGLRQDGDSWGLLSYYVEYDALAFCHIKYVHELQNALSLCGIEHDFKL